MIFNEISSIQAKSLIDLRQAYEAWASCAHEMEHHYAGSMRWQERSNIQYLMRKVGKAEKSLGRQSPDTEKIYSSFISGREAAKKRLTELTQSLNIQSSIARTIGIGRVPNLTARVFRALDKVKILGHIRIVGTNALYAYEALAGVHFAANALATGDVDLLFDARRRLCIMLPDPNQRTILGVLSKVDESFQRLKNKPYSVANNQGFMVDLIHPINSTPWRSQPGENSLLESDLVPSAIEGLQWLVNSPAVKALVVDDRGYPAPIIVPDPRIWLLHKAWLSTRDDRDPPKRRRDILQAKAVLQLLQSHLHQFAMTTQFISSLPKPLREASSILQPEISSQPNTDDDIPQPNWF